MILFLNASFLYLGLALFVSVHCGVCRVCYKYIRDTLFALVDNYLLLCTC